jgi:hypothetical protein
LTSEAALRSLAHSIKGVGAVAATLKKMFRPLYLIVSLVHGIAISCNVSVEPSLKRITVCGKVRSVEEVDHVGRL